MITLDRNRWLWTIAFVIVFIGVPVLFFPKHFETSNAEPESKEPPPPCNPVHIHDFEEDTCWSTGRAKWKIAVVTIATEKYRTDTLPKFLETMRHFFFPRDTVTFFLFVDVLVPGVPDLVQRVIPVLPWGLASMKRWQYILGLNQTLADYDWVVWLDNDYYLREFICDNYFADLVGVRHCLWQAKDAYHAPFETRADSASNVPRDKRRLYFTGSQFAGRPREIHNLASNAQRMKEKDDAKGITAFVIDESHTNAYFNLIRWPDKILSPSFAYNPDFVAGEKETGPYIKRMVHGNKAPKPGLY